MSCLYGNLRLQPWNFRVMASLYRALRTPGSQFLLLLRSLPALYRPVEILERFSSSLPPSFVPGRFATLFFPSPAGAHPLCIGGRP